jgi:D-alanine transaminase
MSRVAYVNGRYLAQREAAIHIEDRGYQFSGRRLRSLRGEGGSIIDQRRHLARLKRSLDELGIAMPMPETALAIVIRECVRQNRVRDGIVYLQITRGVARRDHGFPPPGALPERRSDRPQSRCRGQRANGRGGYRRRHGARQSLGARRHQIDFAAAECPGETGGTRAGAKEAWFVDRAGHVTEGSSSNA